MQNQQTKAELRQPNELELAAIGALKNHTPDGRPSVFMQYNFSNGATFTRAGLLAPMPTTGQGVLDLIARCEKVFPGQRVEFCPLLADFIIGYMGVEFARISDGLEATLQALNDKAVAEAPLRALIREVLQNVIEEGW